MKTTFTGWFTDRNIKPRVFSIKKLKPGVAKTVAKRRGSTSFPLRDAVTLCQCIFSAEKDALISTVSQFKHT